MVSTILQATAKMSATLIAMDIWQLASLKCLVTFYFDTQTGIQAKDKFIRFADGHIRYFIPDTGYMAVNTFVQNKENQAWYYLDEHGYAVTGKRIINGKEYCFDAEGRQIKGQLVNQGSTSYYISVKRVKWQCHALSLKITTGIMLMLQEISFREQK